MDRTVVGQHRVDEVSDASDDLVVAMTDRFTPEIGARHHDWPEPSAPMSVTIALKSRWCTGVYGNMMPISGLPGATSGESGESDGASHSTIGRSRDVNSSASAVVISAKSLAASTSRTMTANGLSGRCLRARRVATAASSVVDASSGIRRVP